jgi:hypothetical protein
MPSILTKKQVKTFRADYYVDGKPETLIAHVRYDDKCGNGHNSFAITGDIFQTYRQPGERRIAHKDGQTLWLNGGGCVHDVIAERLPELAKYIKWHLVSADEPMHYVANTVYHASDRDCWGGRKGDVRTYRYNVRVNGNLVFDVEAGDEHKLPDREEAEAMAERVGGEIVPVPWLLHEGKERDLDAARSTAVWPDATDDELTAPDLAEKLKARLPALMAEFQAAVEELGFVF